MGTPAVTRLFIYCTGRPEKERHLRVGGSGLSREKRLPRCLPLSLVVGVVVGVVMSHPVV